VQLVVGSTYIFTPGVPDIATSISTKFSDSGQPLTQDFTFRIRGVFKATSQAECREKELALKAALKGQSRDIILYTDAGDESAVILKAAGSTTGIQITEGPNFPSTFGPECLEHRRYEFTAVATFPFGVNPDGTGSPQELDSVAVSFQESLRMSGGLPRKIFHEDINGEEPLPEITVLRTTYKATQTGSAVGYLTYPMVPPPIFPDDLIDSEVIPESAPDGVKGWKVSWVHSFESNRPLRALPHFWRREGLTNGQ